MFLKIHVLRYLSAFLLFKTAAGAVLTESSRHIKDYHERIVGGDVAERGQFPYQVQLQFAGTHYCGGAVLNENWIVTAAHCADGGLPITYLVVANQYNVYASEGSERKHAVSRIYIHPEYDANYFPNDIALMKLVKPLTFDEWVSPIALPPANHTPTDGYNATVSGWGSLVEAGLPPRFLHFVQVPFVSDEECNAAYQQIGESIVDSMVCAGLEGKDACQGDSGGPLASNDLADGSTYLAGVVSWGQGCGRTGFPGVYTEVSKFVEWIETTIANN